MPRRHARVAHASEGGSRSLAGCSNARRRRQRVMLQKKNRVVSPSPAVRLRHVLFSRAGIRLPGRKATVARMPVYTGARWRQHVVDYLRPVAILLPPSTPSTARGSRPLLLPRQITGSPRNIGEEG